MSGALSTTQFQNVLQKNTRWYSDWLREASTADLLDRMEGWQYTRLEFDRESDRTFCEIHINDIRTELARRKRLEAHADPSDPYAPRWPSKEQRLQDTRNRIERVKANWPVERFARQVMFCDLKPTSGGRFMSCCPFPDHQDDTPSFVIYTDTDSAHCFGCQRGGDVIHLAAIWFNLPKFRQALEQMEQLSGLGRGQ